MSRSGYIGGIEHPTPLVIAHRGASGDFPENTVAAFRGAVAQGADGVELDVRRSRDGQLVVAHDPRYGDGRAVHAVDAADVPAGVPDLRSALDACGSLLVNVEIKNSPRDPGFDPDRRAADEVVAVLRARSLLGRTIVSSFDMVTIDRVRALEPGIATGWLVGAALRGRMVERCAAAGHRYLHPWDRLVTPRVVERARARGLGVNVWTVDDEARIARLASWGVDAVITNHPTAALDALDPAR